MQLEDRRRNATLIQAPQHDFSPDLVEDRRFAQVIAGRGTMREVRAALLQMAYALESLPGHEAYLLLVGSGITEDRLRHEWKSLTSVLRPDIARRLTICLQSDDGLVGIPAGPDAEARQFLEKRTSEIAPPGATLLSRPDSYFVVLKVLLLHWLRRGEPVTTTWLMKTTGFAYPTVANVLKKMGSLLERTSDRRISLRWFPHEQLQYLVANSLRARSTICFVDRSGKPRSPGEHLRRLRKLALPHVAVGGIMGARHYFPDIDLIGTPRLDLSVHVPGNMLDGGFVRKLDPALQPLGDPLAPASLAIHAVRHAEAFFEPGHHGPVWADPLECLLDLHEARLEKQATEFLEALKCGDIPFNHDVTRGIGPRGHAENQFGAPSGAS